MPGVRHQSAGINFFRVEPGVPEHHFLHRDGNNGGSQRQNTRYLQIAVIAALGLMGVPGLAGFVSKWNLAGAAVESGNVQAYFGIGCLLISALLTAIYMMSIVIRAFFPGRDFDDSAIASVKDPTWKMCLPLICFAASSAMESVL